MQEELKTEIQKMKDSIVAFQAEVKARNEEFFKKAIAFLFDKHPKLEKFSWTQYTPYFCDGDVCEFSANTDYFTINDNDDECSEWGYRSMLEKATPAKVAENKSKLEHLQAKKAAAISQENFREAERIRNEIQSVEYDLECCDRDAILAEQAMFVDIKEVLNAFDEEVLKVLFGDHVRVTIYQDRIETEEYDHE